MAKKTWPFLPKGSSKRRQYTDKQRAAYWKKKYLALLREVKGWA